MPFGLQFVHIDKKERRSQTDALRILFQRNSFCGLRTIDALQFEKQVVMGAL